MRLADAAAVALSVLAPAPADRAEWETLYRGFRDHYKIADNPEAIDRVWQWITTPGAPLEGRVARLPTGEMVALMHFRNVPRPFHGTVGGYMDELFVAESVRGTRVATQMLDALRDIGRARGWRDVRWITSESNPRSCAFYDRETSRTKFVTFEIKF
jgi:GNAT superfamily N-acetyltransferase